MNILRNFIIAFCLIISLNIFGQSNPKIVLDIEGTDCYLFTNYLSPHSDTTHYYVVFEAIFSNDYVKVYADSVLVFNDIVNTDQSIDIAKTVTLGKVGFIDFAGIEINNGSLIYIKLLPDKYYIRIRYWELNNLISICYSKYMPIVY
jgi:hypothetical protein